MTKPRRGTTTRAKICRNSYAPILPQKSVSIKSSTEERSHLRQSAESAKTDPLLPPHLNRLLDETWTSDANRRVDLWLWYCQREFEMVWRLQ